MDSLELLYTDLDKFSWLCPIFRAQWGTQKTGVKREEILSLFFISGLHF